MIYPTEIGGKWSAVVGCQGICWGEEMHHIKAHKIKTVRAL